MTLRFFAFFSFLTFIIRNNIIFGITEIFLLVFVMEKLYFNHQIQKKRFFYAVTLLSIYFISIICFSVFEINEIIKVVNFSLLILVVEKKDFINVLENYKPFIIISIITAILIYFNFLNYNVYYKAPFGFNVNSGLLYEMNYNAILGIMLSLGLLYKKKQISFALLPTITSEYRTGIAGILLHLFSPLFKFKFIRSVSVFFIIVTFYILIENFGALLFQHRYYFYKFFFENLNLLKIYESNEITNLLINDVFKFSPFKTEGFIGINGGEGNLHSGFLDLLSKKGIFYSFFIFLFVFYSMKKIDYKLYPLILFILINFFFFPMSPGGIGIPSVLFSFLIISTFFDDYSYSRRRG